MWNYILSMSHSQNRKGHNMCRLTFKHSPKLKVQPRQNLNPHFKSPFQFKLSLYLEYYLIFKCEIKLEVLCQFKCYAVCYPLHINWLKTSSLISHLDVKLYFKYKLNLNWNGDLKCGFRFCYLISFGLCSNVGLIVLLPILAVAHT